MSKWCIIPTFKFICLSTFCPQKSESVHRRIYARAHVDPSPGQVRTSEQAHHCWWCRQDLLLSQGSGWPDPSHQHHLWGDSFETTFFRQNLNNWRVKVEIHQGLNSGDLNTKIVWSYETILSGRAMFTRRHYNCGRALCLPHNYSVLPSPVVNWHWKREYTLCPFTVYWNSNSGKEIGYQMVWYLTAIWIPDKWRPSCFLRYWSSIQMIGLEQKTAHKLTIWNMNFLKVRYSNFSGV